MKKDTSISDMYVRALNKVSANAIRPEPQTKTMTDIEQRALLAYPKEIMNGLSNGEPSQIDLNEFAREGYIAGATEMLKFAVWYSGMDKEKVLRAYKRYLEESKQQTI